MEALDKSNYIIIGKFWISRYILMSEPCIMSVINSETGESKSYRGSDKVFELLRKEGLDEEPLHEYFDILNGRTKEERLDWWNKFEEWCNEVNKHQEEKDKMKQEDNKLKEEIKNDK